MKAIHCHFTFFLVLVFAIGCGQNVSVTGRVTFPDGTPMTTGAVVFETATMHAMGRIQSDGRYSISTGEERGIPKGTYQVSIGGFEATIEPVLAPPGHKGPPPPARITPPVIPVHDKFLSPFTSGLVCEVKGKTKFDIEVTPP